VTCDTFCIKFHFLTIIFTHSMLAFRLVLYTMLILCTKREKENKMGESKLKTNKESLVGDKSVDRLDTEGLLGRIRDVVKEYESFRSNVLDK
ncbi:hypothetical protein THOM_0243, partial [Trachipleistophora hominis]